MYHRFNENKYPSTNIRNEIFVEHLQEINNIGIVLGLGDRGIHADHIAELGQLAFEDSCHATHPFAVNRDDFHAVYTRAL